MESCFHQWFQQGQSQLGQSPFPSIPTCSVSSSGSAELPWVSYPCWLLPANPAGGCCSCSPGPAVWLDTFTALPISTAVPSKADSSREMHSAHSWLSDSLPWCQHSSFLFIHHGKPKVQIHWMRAWLQWSQGQNSHWCLWAESFTSVLLLVLYHCWLRAKGPFEKALLPRVMLSSGGTAKHSPCAQEASVCILGAL